MPSSAMLMTPDRSENSPPSAARISGVESRIVDHMSETVRSSAMRFGRANPAAKTGQRLAEQRFTRDKQNDDRLQNLDDVLGDVLRERIHRNTAAGEHRKQQRRKHNADRMVSSEQRHCNSRKPVVVREPVVVTV